AETSSGKVVALGEGEVLRSVAFYESGEELTVMVTPVTHIMTGYTFYKMLSGVDPVLAANEATGEMSDIFTFPVDKTSVTDISDERVQNTELSNELTYGFFLAALSSWTQWVSEQNEPEPHLNYNSVGATQIFYDDVFADGFLDGRGLKKDNGETLDLYYGTVKIDQDVYRTAFAQHMLATANSAVNKTSINASELLDFAHTFATNRASIFGTQLPGQLEETPVVYALEKEDAFQRGQFHFTAAIGGITGAKSVEFFIDSETEPLGVASDPLKPYVDIDTASYTDGSHQIRVVATNVFDRTSEENFSYRFDNTSPMISISSPLLTNQTIYQISGTYNDAGSGTKAIEVQGTNASLATNGEWTAPVTLQAGENVLSFTLVDHSGNESTQTFSINLDQTAPNINTDNGHGSALFDNGSGLVSRQITSENIIEALVIDAKNIKLNGVGINRESLDSNGIPYFAFQTEDLPVSGIASSFDDISVFLKYTKNGQILSDWKKIVAVDNEYLLPLVTETLVPEWAESAPNDEQLLFLKSIDKAGNESITQFSFKVDFRVSDVVPDKLLVEGTDYFSAYDGIGFVNRLALNEQEIPVVRYQYTNDANHAKYIKIEDTGNHLLQRSYDEAVRLNKVKFKISTEWRFKPIINLLDRLNCPTGVGDWLSIEKIYNHTNVIDAETGKKKSIWEPRFLPDPVFAEEIDVYSDIPPDIFESDWHPYHFDDNFLVRYAENGDQ
ncbi:MAG: hypothetical protein OEX07_13645, partial [Gammaproteobacteria bacterium]|nr:hypothetical protein [Gammaproteobacteria bacterium]